MANKTVYLRGVLNWSKVQAPDPKFEVYTLDLHMDKDSWITYKEVGLQLKVRESDKDGDYIKVRRPVSRKVGKELVDLGPPQVLLKNADGDFEPFSGLIGNGSVGVVKLRVYDTDRGPGHVLESVAVEDLVEYGETLSPGDEHFPF